MAELKKKLLIFAHYYYPDVASTGQILKDQAEGLKDEFDVTVICVVPSYNGTILAEYKTQKYYIENINGVKVVRIRVPEFKKADKISRIRNITAYFLGAIGVCYKIDKPDYIFTISQPPILGGLIGVLGKRMKHSKMIYCIQDFNPEQIMAVGYFKSKFILKCMMAIDKFSCKYSDLVITVGRDLVETLNGRFSNKNVPKYRMINNWIDEREIYPLEPSNEKVLDFRKKYDLEDKFIIMYSGNMGFYYDLESIIKIIKKFKPGTRTPKGREVVFVFVGNGSILDKLKNYVDTYKMSNVKFIPYQNKENLIYSLNAGDVHWCVNAKKIKGVSCPSKFYGIAAVGKPVLGVLEEGSEIRLLIEESKCGLVCEPGDYNQIEKNIDWFIKKAECKELRKMGENGNRYLIQNFTKDMGIKKYISAIMEIKSD